jgi:phosphoglycolate phosphatase-like HAD superfamily hydrolase
MHIYIFDIDGTLTDSVAAHQRCFGAAFRATGMHDVDDNWSGYRHHTDSGIFREAFARAHGRAPQAGEEARFVDALVREWRQDAAPIREITGAAHFLQRLAETGQIRFAMATGSYRPLALSKLASAGIACPDELLVTASEFDTREDIVAAAIAAASGGCDAARIGSVVSFGDGLWDFHTARNLRLQFVGLGEGARADLLRGAGARVVVPDFSHLGHMLSPQETVRALLV